MGIKHNGSHGHGRESGIAENAEGNNTRTVKFVSVLLVKWKAQHSLIRHPHDLTETSNLLQTSKPINTRASASWDKHGFFLLREIEKGDLSI